MKKTTIYVFCFMFISLRGVTQPSLVSIGPHMHALSGLAYKTKAGMFTNIFAPKQNGPFPLYVNQTTNFVNIMGLSTGLTPPANGRYFYVLRILYGLDTNYNVTLIFLPDVAVENIQGSNDFQFQKGYPIADNTIVYLLDSVGNFVGSAYSATAKTLISNYKDSGNIMVNLYGDIGQPNTRALQFNYTNAQMDAEQSSFAFDEITFYLANSPTVYISSIAEVNYSSGYTNYKHGIAMSRNNPSTIISDNVLAADLGALCPIRCNDLMLYTAPGNLVHPGQTRDRTMLSNQYFR